MCRHRDDRRDPRVLVAEHPAAGVLQIVQRVSDAGVPTRDEPNSPGLHNGKCLREASATMRLLR